MWHPTSDLRTAAKSVSKSLRRSRRKGSFRRLQCDMLEQRALTDDLQHRSRPALHHARFLSLVEPEPGRHGGYPLAGRRLPRKAPHLRERDGQRSRSTSSASPGPSGQQPVIDGENATTSSQFQYFYNPLQEDAVVLIRRSASQSSSYEPSYINISGLEINGYQAYNFTDNTGKTQTYGAFAASLWIEGASNITIQNCTLDNSGLGLFALTNDDAA